MPQLIENGAEMDVRTCQNKWPRGSHAALQNISLGGISRRTHGTFLNDDEALLGDILRGGGCRPGYQTRKANNAAGEAAAALFTLWR